MNAPNRQTWLLRDACPSDESFGPYRDRRCALEAWWEIRDMWLRLLPSMSLEVVGCGDRCRLHWRLRSGAGRLDAELQRACRDLDRYGWCEDGRRGSLLAGIDVADDRLSMRLSCDRSLRRWSDGETLLAEVRAFLIVHGQASTSTD